MSRRADRKEELSPEKIEQHFGPVCEWHFVDNFETPEAAKLCVQELLHSGHHARHVVIEGRCVVARRRTESPL